MTRPFTVKMTDAELEALESLLSHDSDLIVQHDGDNVGLITYDDYSQLVTFWNRAQARAHHTKEERA